MMTKLNTASKGHAQSFPKDAFIVLPLPSQPQTSSDCEKLIRKLTQLSKSFIPGENQTQGNALQISSYLVKITGFLISHPNDEGRSPAENAVDLEICLDLMMNLPLFCKNETYSLHYDGLSFILIVVKRLMAEHILRLFKARFVTSLFSMLQPETLLLANERYHLLWTCLLSHLLSPLNNSSFVRANPTDSPSAVEWMEEAVADVIIPSARYLKKLVENASSFKHTHFSDNLATLALNMTVLSIFNTTSRPYIHPLHLERWQVNHWLTVEEDSKALRQTSFFFIPLSLNPNNSVAKDQQNTYREKLREEGFDDILEQQTVLIRSPLGQGDTSKLKHFLHILSNLLSINTFR
ncbi:hypothetical protein BLNAU_16656 [Blattamonas nauphoetae]|uniref:Uncharacterized protein n=1 Tax=Blattamonas nauphoetae TaxID=2049346 RepID=A0ABQ9XDL9_9EUKA|nr:hypothetical protein BLNAU_16656 [Blattamonas nauphoetae]